MDEAEAAILRAELVAVQAVLMSVFRKLASGRPELTPLFCQAFDEAETILTGVAEKMGLDAPVESTVGALAVIEELRRAVIQNDRSCN